MKSSKKSNSLFAAFVILSLFLSPFYVQITLANDNDVEATPADYVDGQVIVKYTNSDEVTVVPITDGDSVKKTISELENNPAVEYAEPNYKLFPADIGTDDTYKDSLFNLDLIHAKDAWTYSTGTNVIVAVLDLEGVDYTHEDLVTNMWDGTVCTVDDETGTPVVSTCPNHGYDFKYAEVLDETGQITDYTPDFDNDPMPEVLDESHSHGTHIAGIIAAQKNNTKGIAGVAPDAKIMALKFGPTISSEIKAINFAIENGARIINASYVGNFESISEKTAIQAFVDAGGIFIAAAGNCGGTTFALNGCTSQNQTLYPASYDIDGIISIAATDSADHITSFSNFSNLTVDVAAPGESIESTLNGNTYGIKSGTSMASPHVAGLAALIKAYKPEITVEELKNVILTTGDNETDLLEKTVSGKRINAGNALLSLVPIIIPDPAPTPEPPPPAPTPAPSSGGGGGGGGGGSVPSPNPIPTPTPKIPTPNIPTLRPADTTLSISDCMTGYKFSPTTGQECPLNVVDITDKYNFIFTQNLKLGITSPDIIMLQKYLNEHGFLVAEMGAGSPGFETDTFGMKTKIALIKFQSSKNIYPTSGTVGPKTRAVLNLE